MGFGIGLHVRDSLGLACNRTEFGEQRWVMLQTDARPSGGLQCATPRRLHRHGKHPSFRSAAAQLATELSDLDLNERAFRAQ